MAQSNLERVGSAMESLKGGLRPFVEREMRAVLGDRWIEAARQSFGQGRAPAIKGTEVEVGRTGSTHRDVGPVGSRLQEDSRTC